MSAFYVKAGKAGSDEVRWLGPFTTQHMAASVAMGLDDGAGWARVYSATEYAAAARTGQTVGREITS